MENFHQPTSAYWCHQCNSEIAAALALARTHGELICPTCRGGFIEAIDSARAFIHVRRHEQRHLTSLRGPEVESQPNNTVAAAELSFPAFRTEVTRLVRLMDLYSLHSSRHNMAVSAEALALLGDVAQDAYEQSYGDAHETHEFDTPLHHAHGIPRDTVGISIEIDERMPSIFYGDVVAEDAARDAGLDTSSEWRDGSGSEMSLDGNGDEDNEESNSDEELRMLEHGDWISDAESEEVEDGELNAGEFVGDGEHPSEEGASQLEANGQIFHPSRRLRRSLAMNLRSLDLDSYLGNPGDYVDDHGLEEILQQYFDSDNARRGAPPAARAIVECLPTVFGQQKDMDDGSALCAICKDVVALNEPAKQLPCLHLYHSECILPWLGARNSCPVCRYELPTDDPDYEEQRRRENTRQARGREPGGDSSNGTTSSTSFGDVGRDAVSSTEGHVNEELAETERVEMLLDSSNEELGSEGEAKGLDCERNGRVRMRVSLRDVMSSSLFRVVGVVVVSCIGNILMGSSSNRITVSSQAGRVRDFTRPRSWWANLFG